MPEVRLIDDQGAQVGVLKTPDALRFAQERDLDLVEVAPEARPPVCRVLDYSKYKYEQAQKQKQARKHQQQITVREIKFRPKIAQHDYDTKKHHVERFLRHKDKVKVTIMFRGREVTHPERGTMILDRLAEELARVGRRRAAPDAGGAQHDDDARPLQGGAGGPLRRLARRRARPASGAADAVAQAARPRRPLPADAGSRRRRLAEGVGRGGGDASRAARDRVRPPCGGGASRRRRPPCGGGARQAAAEELQPEGAAPAA